jgi:hypothetical protein
MYLAKCRNNNRVEEQLIANDKLDITVNAYNYVVTQEDRKFLVTFDHMADDHPATPSPGIRTGRSTGWYDPSSPLCSLEKGLQRLRTANWYNPSSPLSSLERLLKNQQ